MERKTHFLIVEAPFYTEISDMLAKGAIEALEEMGATYERKSVPGALEIPPTIAMAAPGGMYDGFIALGCVIRGETSHYDIVAGESARGLMDLGIQHRLCIGNGILTCNNRQQAIVRSDPAQKNKGRDAAMAAMELIKIWREYHEPFSG